MTLRADALAQLTDTADYLLVQRALQSGPLQRSKPADFKRCKRPAEVSMAALELLCTIVAAAVDAPSINATASANNDPRVAHCLVGEIRTMAHPMVHQNYEAHVLSRSLGLHPTCTSS